MDIITKLIYGAIIFFPTTGAITLVSIFIEMGIFKIKFNEDSAEPLTMNIVPATIGAIIIAYILVNIFLK